jgi:hypothetical protein
MSAVHYTDQREPGLGSCPRLIPRVTLIPRGRKRCIHTAPRASALRSHRSSANT